MSYFDDASLVFIPSGYKTSKAYSIKPTDGSGDMSFSRSNDTATRVNSAGLIEKVRTNQVLQSETFDNAYWNKTNVSITANAIANPLNGALTADLLTVTDPSGPVEKTILTPQTQSFTAGTPYTISAYFKAGSISTVFRILAYDGTALYTGGTIDLATIGNSSAPYVSVGNGWYRFSFTFTPANSTSVGFIYLVNYAYGVAANAGTNVYVYGAQIERGDIATDYIATTSAAVSVGPVANVPRLDYLNSSCPRLLLEPQRTNLWINSESFSGGSESIVTYTANTTDTLDPAGYNGADKFAVTTSGGDAYTRITRTLAVQAFSVSLYVKGAAGQKFKLFLARDGYTELKELPDTTLNGTWQRLTFSDTFSTTSSSVVLGIEFGWTSSDSVAGQSYYVWGAQVEAGAYATSYIPTLGASVTRGADAASKTGISSLIGSTAGTLFFEGTVNTNGEAADVFLLYNSSNISLGAYLVGFNTSGNITLYALPSASLSILKSGDNRNTRVKIALAYQSGDLVAYVNGVQTFSSAGISLAAGLSALFLNSNNTPANYGIGTYNQALLFKTRLTNAQLAELTTI